MLPEGKVIPRKDILYANPFHLPDQWAFEEKQVLHEATETNPHLVAKKLKNQTLNNSWGTCMIPCIDAGTSIWSGFLSQFIYDNYIQNRYLQFSVNL